MKERKALHTSTIGDFTYTVFQMADVNSKPILAVSPPGASMAAEMLFEATVTREEMTYIVGPFIGVEKAITGVWHYFHLHTNDTVTVLKAIAEAVSQDGVREVYTAYREVLMEHLSNELTELADLRSGRFSHLVAVEGDRIQLYPGLGDGDLAAISSIIQEYCEGEEYTYASVFGDTKDRFFKFECYDHANEVYGELETRERKWERELQEEIGRHQLSAGDMQREMDALQGINASLSEQVHVDLKDARQKLQDAWRLNLELTEARDDIKEERGDARAAGRVLQKRLHKTEGELKKQRSKAQRYETAVGIVSAGLATAGRTREFVPGGAACQVINDVYGLGNQLLEMRQTLTKQNSRVEEGARILSTFEGDQVLPEDVPKRLEAALSDYRDLETVITELKAKAEGQRGQVQNLEITLRACREYVELLDDTVDIVFDKLQGGIPEGVMLKHMEGAGTGRPALIYSIANDLIDSRRSFERLHEELLSEKAIRRDATDQLEGLKVSVARGQCALTEEKASHQETRGQLLTHRNSYEDLAKVVRHVAYKLDNDLYCDRFPYNEDDEAVTPTIAKVYEMANSIVTHRGWMGEHRDVKRELEAKQRELNELKDTTPNARAYAGWLDEVAGLIGMECSGGVNRAQVVARMQEFLGRAADTRELLDRVKSLVSMWTGVTVDDENVMSVAANARDTHGRVVMDNHDAERELRAIITQLQSERADRDGIMKVLKDDIDSVADALNLRKNAAYVGDKDLVAPHVRLMVAEEAQNAVARLELSAEVTSLKDEMLGVVSALNAVEDGNKVSKDDNVALHVRELVATSRFSRADIDGCEYALAKRDEEHEALMSKYQALHDALVVVRSGLQFNKDCPGFTCDENAFVDVKALYEIGNLCLKVRDDRDMWRGHLNNASKTLGMCAKTLGMKEVLAQGPNLSLGTMLMKEFAYREKELAAAEAAGQQCCCNEIAAIQRALEEAGCEGAACVSDPTELPELLKEFIADYEEVLNRQDKALTLCRANGATMLKKFKRVHASRKKLQKRLREARKAHRDTEAELTEYMRGRMNPDTLITQADLHTATEMWKREEGHAKAACALVAEIAKVMERWTNDTRHPGLPGKISELLDANQELIETARNASQLAAGRDGTDLRLRIVTEAIAVVTCGYKKFVETGGVGGGDERFEVTEDFAERNAAAASIYALGNLALDLRRALNRVEDSLDKHSPPRVEYPHEPPNERVDRIVTLILLVEVALDEELDRCVDALELADKEKI